jgi:purine-binding chemotaxis protein CheW
MVGMQEHYSARQMESRQKEQLIQLVGFMIGKEYFGVDILMVQEIIRSTPITGVPNSPDFIEGVINLRGNIIPVIDLRKRLNITKPYINLNKDDTWIMILDVEGRITGFIVDKVTEVLKILDESIEPPPDIVVAGLKSQYIQGVCKIDKRLLILLDFNRILLFDELNKLKELE